MTPSFKSLSRYVTVLWSVAAVAFFFGVVLFGVGMGTYDGGGISTVGAILLGIGLVVFLVGIIAQAIYLGSKGIAETIASQPASAAPTPGHPRPPA